MSEKKESGATGGLSVITDPKDERKRVALVTFAVLAGAASYIIMLFIAMPISVHLIINSADGCDPNVDVACFAPTQKSQQQYTLILTLLRTMTFVFGSLVGTVSDRFGRRPMLILALSGYCVTAVLFLLGWVTKSVAMFFLGGMILGASSPITPHGVAYVSDISKPDRLAVNLGVLQGVGYFLGLMTGAMISLAISIGTTGQEEERGDAGVEAYDKLFYFSYGAGLVFSASAALVTLFFLPESLHAEEKTDKVDIYKANPFGFIYIVKRNPYIFCVWVSAFFAWMAVGASEVVTGGWWLRRYVISDVQRFIIYTVSLWTASGFGAVIMTKVYVAMAGVKGAVHISAIFTIAVGLAFALAPTAELSFIAVGISFLAAAVYPTQLAVLMGQVGPREKGALAGALRGSEALAKLIGILAFGTLFATYIEKFQPDDSCVGAGYNGADNRDNTCECGVETCPEIDATGQLLRWVPSNCSLGQLSPAFHGKPSLTVPFLGAAEPMPVVPQLFVDLGLAKRPDECLGSGMVANPNGFTTSVPRFWCLSLASAKASSGPQAGPLLHAELGCPGFDASTLALEGQLARNAVACADSDPATVCDPALLAQFQAYGNFTNTDLQASAAIFGRIAAGTDVVADVCPQFDLAELNVCLIGPISSFPGLFPMIYLTGLGCLSYLFFLIAEFLFVRHDKEFWKSTEDESLEQATIVGAGALDEN